MSGIEIFGALTGIVTVLEAAGALSSHLGSTSGRAQALQGTRETAAFQHKTTKNLLKTFVWNLEAYENAEGTLCEKDKREIVNIKTSIEGISERSDQKLGELHYAIKDPRSNEKQIARLKDELNTNVSLLKGFQDALTLHLHIQRASSSDVDTEPPRQHSLGALLGLGQENGDEGTTPHGQRTESMASSIAPISRTPTYVGSVHSNHDVADLAYVRNKQLERAVEGGELDKVKDLLSSAEYDRRTASLISTALLIACRCRHISITEYCLTLGASTSLTDPAGLDCMHNAIGTAELFSTSPLNNTIGTILSHLLTHGASASAPDNTDECLRPLHRAVKTKNLAAVNLLLDREKGLVNMLDALGRTALWHACSHSSPDRKIIETLVKNQGTFAGQRRPSMRGRKAEAIARWLDKHKVE